MAKTVPQNRTVPFAPIVLPSVAPSADLVRAPLSAGFDAARCNRTHRAARTAVRSGGAVRWSPGSRTRPWLARLSLLLTCGVVACGLLDSAAAGGGPENLLLVVNQNSPASLEIANWYITLRKIPASNVVYLDLRGEGEKRLVSLDYFRENILQPILAAIEQRGLAPQIDLIVYSADFPTAVDIKPLQNKLKEELGAQADAMLKMYNAQASLNSATFYAGSILADSTALFGLDANWYYRRDLAAALQTPFVGDVQKEYSAAWAELDAARYEPALATFQRLARQHPRQFAVQVGIARAACGLQQPADGALALNQLKRCGWQCRDTLLEFPEIARLQKDDAVRLALKSFTPDLPRVVPSQAFYHRLMWAPNGGINGTPDQSRTYYLSTLLTILPQPRQGMTLAETKAQLQRSVQADATQPQGTVYFSLTKDVRTRTRQPGFEETLRGLRQLGVKAQVVASELPPARSDVLGALTGAANFDWEASGCRIQAGGIVDNLTSFGGRFHGPNKQTPLTELTRRGAAGSSGTVCEPFAIQAKFAHPRIFLHYARGCNLAEAFYQSVQAPFQLLIVGDALCQPWARPIPFSVQGLPNEPVQGTVQLRIESPELDSIGSLELFVDGIRRGVFPRDVPVEFDSTQLSDGYHELRIVAIANQLVASSSRQILSLLVSNQGESLTMTPRSPRCPLADDLVLELPATASPVEIWHNGRVVGTLPSGQTTLRIPAAQLGAGTVHLQAMRQVDGQRIASPPVSVEIE